MTTYTTAQAAIELGVCPSRVRALIKAGRLKARKTGRDYLIKQSALEAVRHRPPGRPRAAQPAMPVEVPAVPVAAPSESDTSY